MTDLNTEREIIQKVWGEAINVVNYAAETMARFAARDYAASAPVASDLLYRFGRHVRNTDEIPPLKWGVQGMDLLTELRAIDPSRYDAEIKALPVASGYQRRQCSKCGEGLGFSEDDPCDNCALATPVPAEKNDWWCCRADYPKHEESCENYVAPFVL